MISITGKVISGYGVASGKGKDNRYPEGTLKLQMPFFNERGLDLSAFFIGTINIDISPYQFSIKKYKYYFKEINWSIYIPPENFIKDLSICPTLKQNLITTKLATYLNYSCLKLKE